MLMALGLLVLAGGIIFAQTDFQSMAKNTFTVDIGPTIVGLAVGPAIKAVDADLGNNATGFGIGAQYERQITRSFSAAARFAYLTAGLGLDVKESGANANLQIDLTSFSVEGHARFYPFGDTFFLDGMLGYAKLTPSLKGTVALSGFGQNFVFHDSYSPSRNYFKLGAKLGWRFCFGSNGGFTFEPSFGYSHGIGLGDSIEKQVANKVNGEASDFDEAFKYIENLVFIGGPRLSLAFGWRF